MRIRSLAINSFRLVASPGMPSVLIIGIDPLAVPGTDGAAVRAALDQELARFGDHVIGGIRKPEPLLPLFEQAVNLVRRHAPKAAIAFNTSGGDSVEAARRWL
jgi:hypothetical protein